MKGIYTKPKGRYKVEEYVDTKNEESRLEEDSSRTPFAEEALNNARDASNNSWQEAKAARDAASVEGPKTTDLADVLKLLEGLPGGVTLAEPAASASAPEVVVKAEALEEEEQESSAEEDAGVTVPLPGWQLGLGRPKRRLPCKRRLRRERRKAHQRPNQLQQLQPRPPGRTRQPLLT